MRDLQWRVIIVFLVFLVSFITLAILKELYIETEQNFLVYLVILLVSVVPTIIPFSIMDGSYSWEDDYWYEKCPFKDMVRTKDLFY